MLCDHILADSGVNFTLAVMPKGAKVLDNYEHFACCTGQTHMVWDFEKNLGLGKSASQIRGKLGVKLAGKLGLEPRVLAREKLLPTPPPHFFIY